MTMWAETGNAIRRWVIATDLGTGRVTVRARGELVVEVAS